MKLNHKLLPMIDYHKAKELLWDPRAIDCAQDQRDWAVMSAEERDLILRVGALFHAGEEAVAHDLAPLLVAVRRAGGHTEDEFFLTTQIFEEAKHLEFFDRWFDEVVGGEVDLASFLGEHYATIFYQVLPEALNRLLIDNSALAQAEASLVYHMIIEGVLAETGYHGFHQALQGRNLLPGLVQGLELVQRDEARHIAFGVYFLQRHVQANPQLWVVIEERMSELLPAALNIVGDAFIPYGDEVPFKLDVAEMVTFASDQFNKRLRAIERVRP
ncbi:ribonucleoside-diphosphate reductase beta chain [Thermoflexales bacterium]|nr:ribonucleoside-diphosphate reductase beta chain [Thermoflexales bacterium]